MHLTINTLGSISLLALLSVLDTVSAIPLQSRTASASLRSCLGQYKFETSYPGDDNFGSYARSENSNLYYTPSVIALPSSQAGAQDVVKCVLAEGGKTKLAVRGGGHSYAAYSLGGDNSHAVLDLRKMHTISINSDAKQATVGAGTRLGQLAPTLADAGFALPHGTSPYVGVAGHALGGGYGLASRTWGYLVDRIQSMQVINIQDGSIVTADAHQNSELFWGLRGGGQNNLGVVLSFTLSPLEDAPQNTVDFSYGYRTNSDCVEVLLALQNTLSLSPNDPHGLPINLTSELLWISEAGASDNGNGQPACTLAGQHVHATLDQHQQAFQVFQDRTRAHGNVDYDPNHTTITAHSNWKDALADPLVMGGFDSNDLTADIDPYYAKSLFQPTSAKYTKKTATVLMNKLNSIAGVGGTGNSISFSGLGGSGSRANNPSELTGTDEVASALPWRNTLFLCQFYSWGEATDSTRSAINSLVDTAKAAAPDEQWGAYINYVDPYQTNWAWTYYGSALQKLKTLKHTWDPKNILDYAQGLAHA